MKREIYRKHVSKFTDKRSTKVIWSMDSIVSVIEINAANIIYIYAYMFNTVQNKEPRRSYAYNIRLKQNQFCYNLIRYITDKISFEILPVNINGVL
jgi:hypothetical protein